MKFELPDPKNLPRDPDQLRELFEQMRLAILVLTGENEQLKRKLFGRKSERISRQDLLGQLLLFSELADMAAEIEVDLADEKEAAKSDEDESDKPPRRKPKRRPLPEHLDRERRQLDPPADELSCLSCGGALEQMAPELSEQLEIRTVEFLVIENARSKWCCPDCKSNVVIAPPAVKPIPKGIPGPGLLAHVLVGKFLDHLPLTRQAAIYARQGVQISVATMVGWVAQAALVLGGIYDVMVADVLKSKVIHTDDVGVRVQTKHSQSETGTVRLWPYLGDPDHPHVVFQFTTSRKRDGPRDFLSGYAGYLQADAYAGYDCIYATGLVKEVACWAHVRRKFVEAREYDAKRTNAILALIGKLYKVERKARGLSSTERQALRERKSQPVLDKIEILLHRYKGEVIPKGPVHAAIGYAINQWRALVRYVCDGDLAIDNNEAERSLRPVVIGRNNWTFFGSDKGGERAAVIYSLVASCKLHGIDAEAYLADVLLRVHTTPADSLWELTPVAWKELHAGKAADLAPEPASEPGATQTADVAG